MPLSPPTSNRRRVHTRAVRYEGFRLEDGQYEIDALLTDIKDDDVQLASGTRPRGVPVHDMGVRVRFNADFVITAVEASTDWAPYMGGCETIAPAYERLVGVSLLQGFRNALRERVGGIAGCTHLTELLAGLPTAAIQMRSGEVDETQGIDGNMPFQLDRCHALATTSETVRNYYPRWYRADPVVPAQALAQWRSPKDAVVPAQAGAQRRSPQDTGFPPARERQE
jgi:hypothetical protein